MSHQHDHCDNDVCTNQTNDHHCNNDHSYCCTTMNQTIPLNSDTQAVYRIGNMDCPTEEALIRKKLANIAGITQLEFNLMQRILTIYHDHASLFEIETALVSIDMAPELITQVDNEKTADFTSEVKWQKLVIAGVIAFAAEIAHFIEAPDWLVLILAVIAIILGGLQTFKKGWIALKNLNLNMNALMSFAVTGALLIGQWPEAAMVMVLFSLAETIETKSMEHARHAIKNLLSLTPEQATVLTSDGQWLEMEIQSIPINSVISVKPGERIALDGKIISGFSTINQAAITGESLPIEKTIGDEVFAGTLNEAGSFEYKTTALATQSTIARIIKAVESAQGSKAQTQRFVDSFAKVYTPIVFVIALSIGIIPPLIQGGFWLEWIYKALVLLVIACPCALVISTPITIVSGLATATRYGILIKGGRFLEQGRKLSVLALDKTGTITYGKPKQTDFINLGSLPEQEIRQIAATLANHSDHPVSRAIANAAKADNVMLFDINNFAAVIGQGTKGNINQQQWYLGNHRMVESLGLCSQQLEQTIGSLEQQGKTVVMLINEHSVQALFAVADTIKQTSIDAIVQLKKMAIKTVILTGDNIHTAQVIGQQVGIDEVKGNLLPEDKLNIINELEKSNIVGMVGDGINDAPALAKADIGFAMGGIGTDTAIETADVTLMDDDLGKIPQFIRLSKRAFSILVQNITFALLVKVVFIILAFIGLANMWMAIFADIGASLLVIANGLRLLKK